MRIRDIIILCSLPFIFLVGLYYYTREPVVYQPANAVRRFRGGQNLTIVFLGDSITAGYGESNHYVHQFRMRLKGTTAFDRTRIFNSGVPGNTAADGLARLEQDVLRYNPDLIYIAFGANEIKNRIPLAEFKNNLSRLIRVIQNSSHAEIILLNLPVFDIPLSKKTVNLFNKAIGDIAQETGTGYLDINRFWKKEIGWFGSALDYMQRDRIHPNEKGHRIIYNAIWRTLN